MDTYGVVTKVFWFCIKIQTGRHGISKPTIIRWDDLPWAVRTKWDWYFKYRAALAQVQNPRAEITVTWGNAEPDTRTRERIRTEQISRQQAKVTKVQNQVNLARANWNDLMPIEEHPHYIKAMAKLDALKAELWRLKTEAI